LLRPETMHQVSIIVAKDELPNLLSYAGREQMIHLVTVDDEHLPPGAAPFEATGLLSKSATIRNRNRRKLRLQFTTSMSSPSSSTKKPQNSKGPSAN